jgi:hypothetical protein
MTGATGGWSDRNSERGADFDFYAMAAGRRAARRPAL